MITSPTAQAPFSNAGSSAYFKFVAASRDYCSSVFWVPFLGHLTRMASSEQIKYSANQIPAFTFWSFFCYFLYVLLCLFWFCLLSFFFCYTLFSLFLYILVASYLYFSSLCLSHPLNWICLELHWVLIRALLYLIMCDIEVAIS